MDVYHESDQSRTERMALFDEVARPMRPDPFWDARTVQRLLDAVEKEAARQEMWWAATRRESPIVPRPLADVPQPGRGEPA